MKILVKDKIKYLPYAYKEEKELEAFVRDHVDFIFGQDSIYLDKNKIESGSGIRSIPDGFVISLSRRNWFVVEVELSEHPLYNHIVPQLTKFYSAVRNTFTVRKLVEAFYNEIVTNPIFDHKVRSFGIDKELYKVLTEIISDQPYIIVIIDKITDELTEICETLHFPVKVLSFQTYRRENSNVLVHLFDTLNILKTSDYSDHLSDERKLKPAYRKIPVDVLNKSYSNTRGRATLDQILEVVELVYSKNMSYSEAVNVVAKRRGIWYTTVNDKCTRRIGLSAEDFKQLLQDRRKLVSYLIERFPKDADEIKRRLMP